MHVVFLVELAIKKFTPCCIFLLEILNVCGADHTNQSRTKSFINFFAIRTLLRYFFKVGFL